MSSASGNTNDNRLEGKSKTRQDVKSTPPSTKPTNSPSLPIIAEDDMDDGDDSFPLITSVFSLASGEDIAESSEAKKSPTNETSKEVTSQEVGINSSSDSPQENGKMLENSSRVVVTTMSPPQSNAPYYVGKGKLILPKPDERKLGTSPGVTFSKMVSIQPICAPNTNGAKNTINTSESKTRTTEILTRSAAKKSEQAAHAPASTSSGQSPVMVNLSNTLPFLNVKLANTQIAVPPMNTTVSTSSTSVLSSSSPLVQLIKRITPTTTTVTPSSGNALVKGTVVIPAIPVQKAKTAAAAAVPNPKVQKPRHVNIAPAPTAISSACLVMLPQTASTAIATNGAKSTQIGNSVPRLVRVPKQGNSSPVTVPAKGQIMYLIENKTADGKMMRFLIPDNAKIVANNSTSQTPVSSSASTTPTQLIKIIPKPTQTSVVTQASKVVVPAAKPILAPTTMAGHVDKQSNATKLSNVESKSNAGSSSSNDGSQMNAGSLTNFGSLSNAGSTMNVGSLTNAGSPSNAGSVSNAGSLIVESENIISPDSTSPTVSTLTPPINEQDSLNTPPTSPKAVDETPPPDSMDTGLSPHEARIQKLKELLRRQEDAVERLREKRKQEIGDVRSSPVVSLKTNTNSANKRDTPFAVPLPPKKCRLDQNKRKLDQANVHTAKDGFLPNSDDQQFVKLVGLEKVVDKIKTKKMLELQESVPK